MAKENWQGRGPPWAWGELHNRKTSTGTRWSCCLLAGVWQRASCTQGHSNFWSHVLDLLEMPAVMLAGCPGLGPKRRVVPRCVVPRGAAAALGRGRCWAFHPGEQLGKFMPSIALSHSLGKMLGKQAEPNCVAPRYLLKVKGDPSLAGQPGLVRGEGLPALRRLEIQLSPPPGATTEAGTTASSAPCER